MIVLVKCTGLEKIRHVHANSIHRTKHVYNFITTLDGCPFNGPLSGMKYPTRTSRAAVATSAGQLPHKDRM